MLVLVSFSSMYYFAKINYIYVLSCKKYTKFSSIKRFLT